MPFIDIVLLIFFPLQCFPAYFALRKIGRSGFGFILLSIPLVSVAYAYTIANAHWKNSGKDGRVIFDHEVKGFQKGPWDT